MHQRLQTLKKKQQQNERVCLRCATVSLRRALPVEHARGQLAGTPLCMEQYYRLFISYRYPGMKTDTLKVQTNALPSAPEHIIVARKNQVRKKKDNFHTAIFQTQASVQLDRNGSILVMFHMQLN